MELIVISILLTLTGAEEIQLEGPENTLSVVGSNVTLKCLSQSRNCNGTEWLKYSHGNPMTIFNHQGIISSNFRDRYSVDNKSGCALIIENVQLTDAGRFICRAFMSSNTVEKSAELIILKDLPKCQTNASEDDTVEGDGVQLTCEVTYNGTNRASMVWKGVQNALAAVEYGKTITRSYSAVASAPEVPSFTCATSFAIETEYNGVWMTGVATNNLPNATCATCAIRVLYSVRNVTLSPSFSNYPPGTVITCAAKGHPSPIFKWQEMEDNGVWVDIQNQKSSEFGMSIVSSKRYRCFATNIVRDKSHNASSQEFLFNNAASGIDIVTGAKKDRKAAELGFGTGIGIGLLVAILLGTVAFAILVRLKYLEFHRRPANKPVDSGSQYMNHEMNPSSRQQSATHQSIPRTGAPLVGEQESAYASLGEDRDANEYAALELRQKAKPKKKLTP